VRRERETGGTMEGPELPTTLEGHGLKEWPVDATADAGTAKGRLRRHLRGRGRDRPRTGHLGTFDFFFDVGCFQGLNSEQRRAEGRGVSAPANPGATLLMLAFQPTRMRSVVGGVSRADVEAASRAGRCSRSSPRTPEGWGWPVTKTTPQWYRLRRQA